MKTISLLTRLTVLATALSGLGLALDVLPFTLFTVALGAFFSLLLAHDYATPVCRWESATMPPPEAAIATATSAVEPLPLAA